MEKTIHVEGDAYFGCCQEKSKFKEPSKELLDGFNQITKEMTWGTMFKTLSYATIGTLGGLATGSTLWIVVGGIGGLIYGLSTGDYDEVTEFVPYDSGGIEEVQATNSEVKTDSFPQLEAPDEKVLDALKAIEDKLSSLGNSHEDVRMLVEQHKAIGVAYNQKQLAEKQTIEVVEVF